jgi:putative transposase
MKYNSIEANTKCHAVRTICRVLGVHPNGFYSWSRDPPCERDRRPLKQIERAKKSWKTSGRGYGYPKVRDDLLDLGAACGKHRTAPLMRLVGGSTQIGYRIDPSSHSGPPAAVAPNRVSRDFSVDRPDRV